MGHQYLGAIPTSKKWTAVVDEVVGGSGLLPEDLKGIAAHTLEAAETALAKGVNDAGLRQTFFLLTQIVLAAQQPDWREKLSQNGIDLGPNASVFELTSQLQFAVDNYLLRYGQPTDVSEIAQQAAGEALAALASEHSISLFEGSAGQLQQAVQSLSSRQGFARFGQVFFGRFLTRFLNFYLSRVTADEVGGERLPTIRHITEFNESLQRHCEESAVIVRQFCGDWYSKTERIEGIDPDNAGRFMAIALRKLRRELEMQGGRA